MDVYRNQKKKMKITHKRCMSMRSEHDFIQEILRVCNSEADPAQKMEIVLRYVGERLGVSRAYVFEMSGDEYCENTFEWRKYPGTDVQNGGIVLPVDHSMSEWLGELNRKKLLKIPNMADYQLRYPATAAIWDVQNVETAIATGIYLGEQLVGFYGVDGVPVMQLDCAAALIKSMELLISLLLGAKRHMQEINSRTKIDTLTGVKNRLGLNWAYEGDFDNTQEIGVLMCDINGLKRKNDKEGHAAGDSYIRKAALALSESFGIENVYRVGGDEFIVVIFGENREKLAERRKKFQSLCELYHVSVSLGTEYRTSAEIPFEAILAIADQRMYEGKRRYYEQRSMDRRAVRTKTNHFLADEIVRELAESYESIFYVDFDRGDMFPYRLSPELQKKYGRRLMQKPSFDNAVAIYVQNEVCAKDKSMVLRMCSKENLKEKLRIKRAFSVDHRIVSGGKEIYYRVTFSNMDGAEPLHHAVVGFTNVEEAVRAVDSMMLSSGNRILIVEDNFLNRQMLREILEPKYQLYEAEDGIEAKAVIEAHSSDIALVLTDLQMPESDGFELIQWLQEHSRYRDIPIVVATAYGDDESKNRCLELGATDFVSKPYNEKVILNRIDSLIRLHGIATTLSQLETDEITGLYTKEAFYIYAQNIIDSNPEKDYVIELSDISGFKAINEQYGKEMGDEVLRYLAFSRPAKDNGYIIGGRISGDIFAAIRVEEDLPLELGEQRVAEVQKNAPVPNLTLKFGLYPTKCGRNLSVQQMCDRAGIALQTIKRRYGVMFAIYNDAMLEDMLLAKEITDSMERALTSDEFKVFYQPKHDVVTGEISGAEALVRWIHPKLGFMSPAKFIPLFEQNGFIKKMDRYIWAKTCEVLAYWRQKGIAVPISVNVSRMDFTEENLAEEIIELVDSYKVPHEYLHIELTESAYAESPELIEETIHKLHESGFVIELDDFGVGFSSIMSLCSLDIDVMKLDGSILQFDDRREGKSVLNFSVQMAKNMKVKIVQEGVETESQLARILEVGCDYAQGYLFSKPLPKLEFEEYLKRYCRKNK